MKTSLALLSCASLIASAPSLFAQDNNNNQNVTDSTSTPRFWEAELPGGSYMVALSRISSISMHSYTVKGAVVHEVDVETMGAALTRFYALEALGEGGTSTAKNIANRAREIAGQVGDKAGIDADTTVHKEYPVTTHAKTIEFRVVDKADLSEIYKSLSKSWKDNRGRKITIK
ncbi:hypothetical protein ACFPK9_02610 [Rubritalea spongiae]|uniref:DUF541 domain-containing protein n=1 Tax=Rubritalea spongiae TaxID=430797 RepID=A0ABW5E265_9BACT